MVQVLWYLFPCMQSWKVKAQQRCVVEQLQLSLSILYLCSDGVEKQPLAIVGSPYWMAPEVLRGELYNEKVNLLCFS